MKKMILLRHVETEGNIPDKDLGVRFMGRKIDVGIIPPTGDLIERVKKEVAGCARVFSSPSRRCLETVSLVTGNPVIKELLLYEIEYGNIDGLYLKQAQQRYPALFEAWKRGEDPRFPNGENSQDVLDRYLSFIDNLQKYPSGDVLACTHNVFLRVALGYSLGIPMRDWFKISVPHFEPIPFDLNDGTTSYSGTAEQRAKILKNFK